MLNRPAFPQLGDDPPEPKRTEAFQKPGKRQSGPLCIRIFTVRGSLFGANQRAVVSRAVATVSLGHQVSGKFLQFFANYLHIDTLVAFSTWAFRARCYYRYRARIQVVGSIRLGARIIELIASQICILFPHLPGASQLSQYRESCFRRPTGMKQNRTGPRKLTGLRIRHNDQCVCGD